MKNNTNSPAKYTMIAPVGDQLSALYITIRDFPIDKLILLTPTPYLDDANRTALALEKFKIKCHIIEIKGNPWEEMFATIQRLSTTESNIIVNTATGDRTTTCAATSAAFVNGLKAVSVEGTETMLLPILRFSYSRIISERKQVILRTLQNPCGLADLTRATKMSPSLVSYHIHGTRDSPGLLELGLAELNQNQVHLSLLGKLLVKGHLQHNKKA